MKKLSLYIFLGLMWCNIGYSKEIVNLVCSWEKSIENRPMGDVVIGTKGDPDFSHYTDGRYIEYEVVSKDEFYIISTSFLYEEVLPEKKRSKKTGPSCCRRVSHLALPTPSLRQLASLKHDAVNRFGSLSV